MISIHPRWVRVLAALCVAGCATTAPAPPDKLALVALLKNGQYTALEDKITGYQERFEADQDANRHTQWPVIYAFEAFENSDAALEPRLNEWVAKMPRSYAATLARGAFNAHVARLCHDGGTGRAYARSFGAADRDAASARLDIQHALTLNPRLVYAYRALANMALNEGNRAEMGRILHAGLDEVPDAVPLHVTLLRNLQPDEIHGFLVTLGERYPHIAATDWFPGYEKYAGGQRLMADGRYEEALAQFDRALAVGPRVPGFLGGRAEALFELGRLAEAIDTQETLVELRPQEPVYQFGLANLLLALGGRGADALGSIDKAIALDGLNPCYLLTRAAALEGLGRYKAAADDLDAAITYGASKPEIQIARAHMLMRFRDRLDDAVFAGERATALQPQNSLAWLRYAEALFLKQDCKAQQAMQIFRDRCQSDGRCGAAASDSMPAAIDYMPCHKT